MFPLADPSPGAIPPLPRTAHAQTAVRGPLDALSDRELLALRLCDLDVSLEGSWVADLIDQVLGELAATGLRLRPHFWLSEEWFSPDAVPGVAVPFYLAHPRLVRLERRQMLEAEGATRESCLKLLRHEVGHAVQHAYRLHRRPSWRAKFGSSSTPYPDFYRPDPTSRQHVLHLDYWYAQAHPDEDFAETFAVWLTPGSRWRQAYRGWAALEKLEYVDELVRTLEGVAPPVRSRARPEHLPRLRRTLADYYAEKRERFEGNGDEVWDEDLMRLFSKPEGSAKGMAADRPRGESAAAFLHRARGRVRRRVARCTARHEYAIDLVLREMTARCRELGLRATAPADQLERDLAILVAARGAEYVSWRREWHAL